MRPKRSVKTHKSGGSETGSRASSSRDSEAKKKRMSLEKHHSRNGTEGNGENGYNLRLQTASGVNIDLKGAGEGQTINVRRPGENGVDISIGSRRAKERPSRSYSVSSRAAIKEAGEGDVESSRSRRRSMSRRPDDVSGPAHPADYEGGLVDSFRRLRTESKNRRSSRSGVRPRHPEFVGYE